MDGNTMFLRIVYIFVFVGLIMVFSPIINSWFINHKEHNACTDAGGHIIDNGGNYFICIDSNNRIINFDSIN
jgi:hypothetical protein